MKLSIQTRILIPLTLLMLLSLVGSAIGFLLSTNATRNEILDGQLSEDRRRLVDAWQRRADDLTISARLLSEDTSLITALAGDRILDLDRRAVTIRDRFNLDQVVVVNREGKARVNIVTRSELSRADVPARLAALAPATDDTPILLPLGAGSVLLVGRRPVWAQGNPDLNDQPLGTIYTVLDVARETGQLRRELELQSLVQLATDRVVAVSPDEAALAPLRARPLLSSQRDTDLPGGRYRTTSATFTLGDTPVQLALLRSEETINTIVAAGFQVMLISSGVTLLLLLVLGVVLARSVTYPIRTLAGMAGALATGDLSRRANLDSEDEIGQLGQALDHAADTIARLLDEQAKNLGELQAIMTSIADGVLAIDARGAVVLANPAALTLLNSRSETLLGQPVDALLAVENVALVDGMQAIVGQIRSELTDADLRVTEGRVTIGARVLGLRSAPIVRERSILGAVMVLQDITAAVIAEQVKSDFIAVASHELRTPLTSLKGHIDLLFLLDTANLSADQQTSLSTIRRQANNLVQLVNDLLEMARIEQGRLIAERVWIDPALVLREVMHELDGQAESRGIRLLSTIDPQLPQLWIDPLHLRRILINLLANAIKYSPDGKAVTLRAYELSDPSQLPSPPHNPHWPYHDQRSVVLEIEDRGVGIRAEDQPKIFTRFFRSQNPRSTEAGGTGLGLAITQALVQLHGGQIGFRSAEGQGSCFWVRLPVVTVAPLDGSPLDVGPYQVPVSLGGG
ncbi:MAG TPA: ATP-binding protein [Roseiflexaceae bacterium]|nr:ATP-binding protein [Roseiflexaceae bacterium]